MGDGDRKGRKGSRRAEERQKGGSELSKLRHPRFSLRTHISERDDGALHEGFNRTHSSLPPDLEHSRCHSPATILPSIEG
jgi:hypothetical protein